MKKTKTVLLRGIDPDLWRRFRSRAVLHGVTLGEAVSKLIEAYLAAPAAKKGGQR